MFIYNQCTKSNFPEQQPADQETFLIFVHGSHPFSATTTDKPCSFLVSCSAPGASPPLAAPLCSLLFSPQGCRTGRHSAAPRFLLRACLCTMRTLTTYTLLICDSSSVLPAFREWLLLFCPSCYIRKLNCFICPSTLKLGYCIHCLQYQFMVLLWLLHSSHWFLDKRLLYKIN